MFKRFKSASSGKIIAFLAFILIALHLLSGIFSFVITTINYQNGSLKEEVLQYDDFELFSMQNNLQGNLSSSDNDPQMILEKNMKLNSITFYMETSIYPGEVIMYYTTKEGAGFSERKRVWAKPIQGKDNWYQIDLPLKNVLSIRIDPGMYAGNEFVFGDFIFNQKKSFFNHFTISYGTAFNFLIYTGLIGSLLKFIQELLTNKVE